jgi:hypothetical protein
MRRCGAKTSFNSASVSAIDWLARRLASSLCGKGVPTTIGRTKAVDSLVEGVLSIVVS